jgi:DNA replication protein DnaC
MKEVRMSSDDLAGLLLRVRLRATAEGLDDLLSRAIKQKWSHRQLLEEMARQEVSARAARNLERRLAAAHIGRFKTMADFDWNWPKKIDRELIERWLRLEPIAEGRNLILLGSNGVGKTTIAKNAAYQAVMAGRSVLFRTA